MSVKIITDTCCSLSREELKNLGVDYVQMNIQVDDQFFDAYDCPIKNPDEFYNLIKQASKVSTGCVNVQTFTEIFEKYAHMGDDVVYVGLSSGLSSTYSNAVIASDYVNKTCGKHIWVADSLTGGFAIAKMISRALQMARENKTAQEIYDAIHNNGIGTLTYFIPCDLQFLAKCGRLNKIVATFGSALKIVPTLSTDQEGKLRLIGNTIGRKKAMKNLTKLLTEKMELQTEERVYIGHTGQYAEADELAKIIKEIAPNKTVEVGYIDYTLACCCGPETLAVFVTGK